MHSNFFPRSHFFTVRIDWVWWSGNIRHWKIHKSSNIGCGFFSKIMFKVNFETFKDWTKCTNHELRFRCRMWWILSILFSAKIFLYHKKIKVYRFPEFLAIFCSVTSSDYKYVKIRSICVTDGNQESKGARVINWEWGSSIKRASWNKSRAGKERGGGGYAIL